MRRTERLFRIIQILRSRRRPTTGRALADEIEVSLRTLYRDMAELIAQGVPIRGEAGTGYVLSPGYDMPPLMLTPDELEAAVLGAAWVARRGDPALARGARDLIGKLVEAVPRELRPVLLDASLKPLSFKHIEQEACDIGGIRNAIRDGRVVEISYRDGDDRLSTRRVWPFLIGYTEEIRMIAAWCELRADFRHFRTDRILTARALNELMPTRPSALRQKWKSRASHHKENVKPDG